MAEGTATTRPSLLEAAERAYGILWHEPSPSQHAIDARHQLLAALDQDAKARGVQYAIKYFGQPQTPDGI